MLDAGGTIVEILSTASFRPPTRPQLDAWVDTYHLRVTTVMDPPGVGTRTQDTYGQRETIYVVEVATMRIVDKIEGSVAGIGDSAVGQAVPRILRLLAR